MIRFVIGVAFALVRGGTQDQNNTHFRFNELTLKHDHCVYPQVFDRDNYTCVCPDSTTKSGNECVCVDCLFRTSTEEYVEKSWEDLIEYDKEMKNEEEEKSTKKPGEEQIASRGMFESKVLSAKIIRLPNSAKFKVLKLKEPPRYFTLEPTTAKPEATPTNDTSDTFSDSFIFGNTSGSVSLDRDRAYGSVTATKGTGSLAMAANGGSGAVSAFTGEGSSQAGIQSDGAESSGFSFIGPNAEKASSTSILLTGKGDAVATNTLTEDASGSAVAVATQQAASASSSAFGAAVAGTSAAPGKLGANSSASYGDSLNVEANVRGKGVVAETVSAGNSKDSLQAALRDRDKGQQGSVGGFDFSKQKSEDIDLFDSENAHGAWLWN